VPRTPEPLAGLGLAVTIAGAGPPPAARARRRLLAQPRILCGLSL